MDYHHVIFNEDNIPLPNGYMHVLYKHDWDSYDTRRRHDQMHEPSMYSHEANIGDNDHDDGMV